MGDRVTQGVCARCGRGLDEHDRHVRMLLPDPVLPLSEEERKQRTWGGDELLQVQGVGAFVRVLLPIRLMDGYSLTLGTWLAIDPALLHGVWAAWSTDRYANLALDGYLANAIPPWGDAVLGAPASAAVRDPGQFPYIHASEHALLGSILSTELPHDEVLSAYSGLGAGA